MSTQASSRRSFLKNSLAMSATCCLTQSVTSLQAAAAPHKRSQMQFGLVTYLWGQHMTLAELLDGCAAAGLTGVELRTEHKHAVEPKLSAAERQEVKQRFADSGITLVGYGSNAEYHANDPAKLNANIELTKEYIRLMHDCGGSGVKVKPNALLKDVPPEQTIEQIGKALNEVAAYGENYGQQIRVEVHGSGTSEIPVMRDIFQVADHPNATICWNSNGEDLHGEGLAANFQMLRGRFGATCHVRELDGSEYPYAELMRLLVDSDYDGWILLEARTDPQDKVAAMAEQKKLFDKLTGAGEK